MNFRAARIGETVRAHRDQLIAHDDRYNAARLFRDIQKPFDRGDNAVQIFGNLVALQSGQTMQAQIQNGFRLNF